MRLTIRTLAITMPHTQDITITNTPTIMGIMATVITRFWALVTVTEVMAAIEEGTETTGTVDMAVITAAIRAASIDKNANIFI